MSAFKRAWWRILAAEQGDWDKFRSLFPDNDDYDIWQFPKLHNITLGLISGDLEQELLKPGIDIDAIDSEGLTALSWASKRGDAAAIALLIKAKASVNKADYLGDTPLMLAQRISCLKLLLEAGADVKVRNSLAETPLHRSPPRLVQSNPSETVQSLVSAGADIEARDHWGSTPLFQSITNYKYDSWTRAFLDCGANIDIQDNNGDTPLNNAIFYQRNDHVALLLQRGAAYTLLNKNDDSVLHFAARYGSPQIIKVLDAANLRDVDTETLNKQCKTARQEAEERDSKSDGFLERFDELLAGIRARSESSHGGPADSTSTEDGQVGDIEDEFVDALEEQ